MTAENSTLSERILGAPAGEYVDKKVDRAFAHDGTGIQALIALKGFKNQKIKDPGMISIIYDHIAPANNTTAANLQHELRDFSCSEGFSFYDVGCGICHQVMSEGLCLPGEIVVGADSHSCTMGALGAFATGVGATDMAGIWATGETWFKVPETIEINLSGELGGFSDPKDAALLYVKKLGMDGGTYKALEFTGEGAENMPVEGRLTLSNMAVETGAKAGLFYSDKKTQEYLSGFGKEAGRQAKQDCTYESSVEIDLSGIEPLLAVPDRVDNAVPVTKYSGTNLDEVFVGTCTNGRYEDLRRFAGIVKGKKVSVRTIVVPASRNVLLKALSGGLIEDIVKAGCTVCPPGCGPCLGAHMGVLGEGEVGLSTANRNFRNRMGVGAEYFLCSPSTAAASALKGEITSPEDIS
ncbi:aconitase/3-isopropylmalate dehydratase large subunit family protein [Methanomicrobium sp. W14]|uniref:aconitase/3-isopropylmalate dehydratase large subunit family protein n=1 Tax=Methanomicrobium sp. W14 TaxID=2817839 RepID=UPI001AE1EC30